jgi:hypothetical protein
MGSMCLAFVMAFVLLQPLSVQAATKSKSLTLYKGEEIYVSNYSTVKSVSSSKKSVATVAKDKQYDTHANITAKNTGKSTVTVKTKSGTVKYNVTVKKLDIKGTLTDMGDGNLLLAVKNNTKQTFTAITVTYTLKDESGEIIKKDTKTISDVVAEKTAYSTVSYDARSYSIDLSQCSVKAENDSRSLSATYKNASSKVTTTIEREDASGTLKLSIKSKNTLKDNAVSGYNYIRIYDENGDLVYLIASSLYLKGGAVDTVTRSAYFSSDTDTSQYTYDVTTVAYYTIY